MKEKKETQPLINMRIRAPQMQLITQDGENKGIVTRDEALRMADQAELDLVMIAEKGSDGVPVVKIMDFGKSLYEKKKKQAQAKKQQKIIQIKEIKMRTKIGEHDYQTKMNQAIQFLKEGKRVKFTLTFRGREHITKQERGAEFFEKIENSLAQQGILKDLVREKDLRVGSFWSRVYYLKSK